MNIKLHYVEKGEGFPLILLHGNGEEHTYFSHQIEYFSETRRVIAIDTRGHGQTPRGNKPFTIKQFAEDLLRFMDEQRIETADILGFSDGGNIALTFALKYPKRINKLVLNGANLCPNGVKSTVQIPIIIGYHIAKLLGGKAKAELLGLMVNEPNITTDELQSLSVPTLVIAGNKDMIKASHTELIAASIPESTLCFISGDHFIAYKQSGVFNNVVNAFLSDA